MSDPLAPKPTPSPFDAFVQETINKDVENALPTMDAIAPISPDVMGQAVRTKDRLKTNATALALSQEPADLQAQDRRDQLREILRANPKMIEYIRDPEDAALIQDEIETIAQYEVYTDPNAGEFGTGLETGITSGKMAYQGVKAWASTEGVVLAETNLSSFEFIDNLPPSMPHQQKVQELVQFFGGTSTAGINPDAARYLNSTDPDERAGIRQQQIDSVITGEEDLIEISRMLAGYQASLPEGEEFSVDNFVNWTQSVAGQAVPMLVGAIAIGMVSGGTGAAAFGGTYALGSSYQETILEGGDIMDADFRDRAMFAAVVSGGLEVALGPVSRVVHSRLRGVPEGLLEEAAKGYLRTAGREITTNALEEGAQEVLQQALQNWAVDGSLEWTQEALVEYLQAFVGGAVVGGPVGGVVTAPSTIAANRRSDELAAADVQSQTIEGINKTVEETKLRDRAPSRFSRFLNQQGFNERSIFVDAPALAALAAERPAIVGTLGITQAQIDQAIQNGSSVPVNMAQYMINVPVRDPELATFIANNGRMTQEAMSAAEASEYQATEAKERAKEAAAAAVETGQQVTRQSQFIERVTEQLETAGQTRTAAQASGQLWGGIANSLATRFGDDKVFDMLGVDIRGPAGQRAAATGTSRQYSQTQTAEPDIAQNTIVDARGEPARMYHGTNQQSGQFDGNRIFMTNQSGLASQHALRNGYEGARVVEGTVAMENPLERKIVGEPDAYYLQNSEELEAALDGGVYDGVMLYNEAGDLMVIATSNEQITQTQRTEGETRGRQEPSGDARGRTRSGSLSALEGAPTVRGVSGPDPRLVAVAEQYAEANGIDLKRQAEFVEVDPEFAARVADEYEAMEHNPNDPAVREAYENLIQQTVAQYEALVDAGYKFYFIDLESQEGQDYAASPWNAMFDTRDNQVMGVFSTAEGFGTDADFSPDANPLLAETGFEWPLGPNGEMRPVYANDLFRAVHDAFGHGIEFAGFRARGEENAWQAHQRLFTGSAVAAITTETRGQNSWLNYGPNGEANRTASVEDTVFADQKTGLLPEWAWTENVAPDDVGAGDVRVFEQSGVDQASQGEAITRMDASGDTPDRISTRLPWTARATEDPMQENLVIGLDAMKSKPDAFAFNMDVIKDYVGFNPTSTDPDVVAEEFIGFVTDNLRWLYNQIPAEIRDRSRLWYNGSRKITERWSADYGLPDFKVAGVLASLSPQKDWYQNVSLGERVIDIYTNYTTGNNAAYVATPEMAETASRIYAKEQYAEDVKTVLSSTLGDLPNAVHKAMWIRIYDETYNARGYRTVSSEGDFLGEPQGNVAWGSNVEIAKAVRTLEADTIDQVSTEMGTKHKVRNFYNNILAPDAPHGDVTIDTHAVAASLLRPLSGNSPEVHHNFGSSPAKAKQPAGWRAMKNIGDAGSHGSYGIYAEAHRRLAAELGILPRELQSITWEAVRGVFSPKQKSNKAFLAQVTAAWEASAGSADLDAVRSQIVNDIAGGINDPTWYGPSSELATAKEDASYSGELVSIRLSRRPAGQLVAGDGGSTGAAAGAGGVSGGPRQLNQDARGLITIPTEGVLDGTAIIDLMKNSDLSTFLHESGHFFLEAFQGLATMAEAPQGMREDLIKINEWMGREASDTSTYTTEQQEMWAETFETYLMQGTAPTPTLKAAFARFARWLSYIYKGAKLSRADLTPEIRDVMDRLVATDEELATAREYADAKPLFKETGDMNEQDFETYQRSAERSDASAQGKALEAMMVKIRRQRTKEYKKRLEQVKLEVEEEVAVRREYVMIAALGGRDEDFGDGARLNKAAMVEMFGPAILDDLKSSQHGTKKNLYMDGGSDPDLVAETFGYRNASAMVNAIRSTPPIEKTIDKEARETVDREMLSDMTEPAIKAEAEAAINNPARNELVAREISQLQRQAGGKPTRWQVLNRIAADKAERALETMVVRDIMNYRQYLRASQKASREAQRQFAKVVSTAERQTGKSLAALKAAAVAKQQQLEADHLYRAAREQARKIESFRKRTQRLKKTTTQKAIGPDYMDAVDTILDKYDMRVLGPKEAKKTADLAGFHAAMMQNALSASVAFDPSTILSTTPRHYSTIEGAELMAVMDTVDNIIHMGREATSIDTERGKMELADVLGEIEVLVGDNIRGKAVERSLGSRGGFNTENIRHTLMNPDALIDEIDHGGVGAGKLGTLYNAVKLPIDRALDRLDQRRQTAATDMNNLFAILGGAKGISKLSRDHKVYPQLNGDKLSTMDLIMFALNLGNAGNAQRIEYDINALQGVLNSTLTEQQWRFVQDTWDYLDSFWPEINETHRKLTGLRTGKVKHEMMISGAPEFVTGGYFPIRYDKELSNSAENIDRASLLLEGKAGSFLKAQTPAGHKKARLDKVNNKKILLDPSIISNHVFNVLHDLELGEPVQNAGKIIYNDKFKEILNTKKRGNDSIYMKSWLEDIAIGEHRLMAHTGAKFIRWMRGSVSAQAMGFNMSTAVIQLTGVVNSLVEVGPKHMMRGYGHMFKPEARERVYEASPFMVERIRTFNTDMSELTGLNSDLGVPQSTFGRTLTKTQQTLLPWAFMAIQYTQFYAADLPTWLGAYDQAVTGGQSPAAAVAFADKTVRSTQGSGRIGDRSNIERGRLGNADPNAAITMATFLYSFMNMKLNRAYLASRGMGKAYQAQHYKVLGAQMAAAMWILYADEIAYTFIKEGMPDEEDDETWGGMYSKTLFAPVSLFPVGREAMSYFRFGDIQGPFSSSVGGVSEALVAGRDLLVEGKDPAGNAADMAEGAAIALGLPMSQLIKLMEDTFDPSLGDDERLEKISRRLFGEIVYETLENL